MTPQPPPGIRAEIEKLLYEFDPGGYVEEIDLAKWEALIEREKKAAVEEALAQWYCQPARSHETLPTEEIIAFVEVKFPATHADQ